MASPNADVEARAVPMKLVPCNDAQRAQPILDIVTEAVANSTRCATTGPVTWKAWPDRSMPRGLAATRCWAWVQGVHVLVRGIDAVNQGSTALHTRLGFEHDSTIRQAGFKLARGLCLAFCQRILDTSAQPVDG